VTSLGCCLWCAESQVPTEGCGGYCRDGLSNPQHSLRLCSLSTGLSLGKGSVFLKAALHGDEPTPASAAGWREATYATATRPRIRQCCQTTSPSCGCRQPVPSRPKWSRKWREGRQWKVRVRPPWLMGPSSRGQYSPVRGSWSFEEKPGLGGCSGWSCWKLWNALENQSPASPKCSSIEKPSEVAPAAAHPQPARWLPDGQCQP
jgi:hypothetical protein